MQNYRVNGIACGGWANGVGAEIARLDGHAVSGVQS